MKYVLILACGLLLTGCIVPDGTEAQFVCKERETVSGKCTSGEYFCYPPMVPKADEHKRPRCYMEGDKP